MCTFCWLWNENHNPCTKSQPLHRCVQVFNHHYEDLYMFPWERKRPKALMRASQQGCMPANSSRAVLAVTSEYHPQRLDLGITRIDGSDKHFLKFRWVLDGTERQH